jgi:hypothetical protein
MKIDETPQREPPSDSHDSKVSHDLSTTRLPETAEETDELSPRDFLVLVVEDSIDNAVVIRMDLQEQGYRTMLIPYLKHSTRVFAPSLLKDWRSELPLLEIG